MNINFAIDSTVQKAFNLFYNSSKGMIMFFSFIFISSCSNFSQKIDDNPNVKYFENYLSSKSQYDMLKISFPTLAECKLVFKEKYATTYFNWINSIKDEYFNSGKTKDFLTDFGMIKYVYSEDESDTINNGVKIFKSVKYDSISTSEFKEEWKTFYEPNVKIYRIVFLNEINDENGFEYNGFVSINNQWKFFPKPKRSIFSN
jgi:hypothetical protein